jgi:uncharacterized protein (UPF0332 family)
LAEEFLQDANKNLGNRRIRTSISRSYYSVYHSCVALFEHYGYKAHFFIGRSGKPSKKWEHGIIIKKSYDELVKRHKILELQDVWFINRLYNNRIQADYRHDLSVSERSAKESYDMAHAIYNKIRKVLQ